MACQIVNGYFISRGQGITFITRFYLSYLPPALLEQDMTQGQFFKRSLTGLNSEFSFS